MKQVCNSTISIINGDENKTSGRMFDFSLNEKKAEAKLLKGAIRATHMEVESKSGCVTLRFSDGAYLHIVLLLLREWNSKVNDIVKINDTEIRILEADVGMDNTEKHVDTKLVILANNNRLVIHIYNGTQNLMVQGKNYEAFALNCLKPYFQDRIEDAIDEITKCTVYFP